MSENTSSPHDPSQEEQPEQEGTFVGGSFGDPDHQAPDQQPEGEDLTTAQEQAAEQEDASILAGAPEAPSTDEFVEAAGQESPSGQGDVEGITGEPAPGDRNEPV
ncbi:hypothetical protein ACQBAT_04785 [Ornithinimicrobium sp. Y1847]|uniref:hypothetical protein n=1 Tax=unclassified Ornithinimicrobium TaxID=2615080 RepID=UPI003B66BE7B